MQLCKYNYHENKNSMINDITYYKKLFYDMNSHNSYI